MDIQTGRAQDIRVAGCRAKIVGNAGKAQTGNAVGIDFQVGILVIQVTTIVVGIIQRAAQTKAHTIPARQ